MAAELKASVSPVEDADAPQISRCLTHAPETPQTLETRYKKAWGKLTAAIQAIHPAWKPPDSGYISWLPFSFESILERFNVLAAPASIFGSQSEAVSVISCLNEVLKKESPESKS